MAEQVIFLKMNAKVKMAEGTIRIGDLGKIYSTKEEITNKVKTLKVYHFKKEDKNRCVIGILKVIERIHQEYPSCQVEIVGETETIVEYINGKKQPQWVGNLKIAVAAGICFLGTLYTIMAYHNEISIIRLFDQIYAMVTGNITDGFTILEVSYSIGLSLGIIVFYNHIGKRRLTPDPSPVEVEMRSYEDEVNNTLVEMANREEKTIDVS